MSKKGRDWFIITWVTLLSVVLLALIFLTGFGPNSTTELKQSKDGTQVVEICERTEWFGPTTCEWLELETE